MYNQFMLILIAMATFVFTLIGGLVALKFKDRLHIILGFSAGAVVAVAFFDILPEALDLGSKYYDSSIITGTVGLGFLIYLILDRVVFLHAHAHDETDQEHVALSFPESKHIRRGTLGASTLSIHSFIDGVAIGLAFQVSAAVGIIVAVAVLIHDFSDGINTVGLILKNKGEGARALRWLAVDAVAPVLGVVSTLFFTLPEQNLSIILALFCGFFLYIGATDLIPESHHAHPKLLTTGMTLLGAGVLYLAIQLAHV
ncbi:MAG: ZIP family metal transporter [Candidatus Taylorbacteria bacterium]|nr:ZIP family metal transporter [Candidatus Taylorbacteria bacterium]